MCLNTPTDLKQIYCLVSIITLLILLNTFERYMHQQQHQMNVNGGDDLCVSQLYLHSLILSYSEPIFIYMIPLMCYAVHVRINCTVMKYGNN